MSSEPLRPQLDRVVAEALGVADAALDDLTRLSGGASRSTWSLTADDGTGRQPLILQLGGPVNEANPRPGMDFEAIGIRAAADVGVPVPELLSASGEPDEIGSPYLLTGHVEGETIARRILRDDEFATARRVLAGQCGRALAAIHTIDPAVLPDPPDDDPVERYREVLDDMGPPSPTFEWAFRELGATRPPASGRTVVHGDFRNGNLIIGPDGLRAVIDWELLHVGDPLEDLAWLCSMPWRFRGPEPVGGFGSYDDLLDGYAEVAGHRPDLDHLRWWVAFGSLKWGIMCITQGFRHLSGMTRSMEHAAIGRRVAENEWDLLEMLA